MMSSTKQRNALCIVVPDNAKIDGIVRNNIGGILNGVGLWVPIESYEGIVKELHALMLDCIGYATASTVIDVGIRPILPSDVPLTHDVECYVFDRCYQVAEEILESYLRGIEGANLDLGNAFSDFIRNNIYYLYQHAIEQVINGLVSAADSNVVIMDATYKLRDNTIVVMITLA